MNIVRTSGGDGDEDEGAETTNDVLKEVSEDTGDYNFEALVDTQ